MPSRRRSPYERLTADEVAEIENRAIEWFLRYMADRMTTGDEKAPFSIDRPEHPAPWTAEDLRRLADEREHWGHIGSAYWTRVGLLGVRERRKRGARLTAAKKRSGTAAFIVDIEARIRKNPRLTQAAAIEAYLASQEPAWDALTGPERQKRVETKKRLYRLHGNRKVATRPKIA